MPQNKKVTKGERVGDLQAYFEDARTPEEFEALAAQLRKTRKVQVRISLDADILAWFREGGPGYQTRINWALRKVMMDAQARAPVSGLPGEGEQS